MTKIEYFKYAFSSQTRECTKLRWYYSVFTISDETEFIKKNDLRYIAIIKDPNTGAIREEVLVDSNVKDPLFKPSDKLELNPGDLPIVKKKETTTLGRYIFNYLFFCNILKDKPEVLNNIEYINEMTGVGPVESIFNSLLRENKIEVSYYGKFVDTCSFLQDLSRIFTVVCTPKNITPPPGLDEVKKKLTKEYDDKYGKGWSNNVQLVASYTEELKKVDKEYLKDDRSTGKLMIPKVTENSRVKMYISFGIDRGMDENSVYVGDSLSDGYPVDKDKLATIYNSIIFGSFSRGNETVKGGVLAKALLRSGLNCVISPGDCGTNLYLEVLFTEENCKSYLDRYMVTPNGIAPIENPKELIGKVVKVRSPMFCRLEGKRFCSSCVGKAIGDRKFGIPLLLTDIGGTILNSSMKAMHDTSIKKIKVTVADIIK